MPKPPIASLTRARTVATTRLRSRNCSLAEIPRLLQLTAKNRGWAIVGVLKLVDLSLTANLPLIVICSSYENFVARIDPADHTHWPEGLIGIGFSGLKQKLLGSIVAIAAVNVLEWFLDIDRSVDNIKLGWVVGILLRSPVSSSATVAGAGQVSFAVNCKFSQFCPLSETSVAPRFRIVANALPSGVAFNFALGRLTSETAVSSARSRDTVSFRAGYFDLSPSMGPFEYDDPGPSGIYRKTRADKGRVPK